MDEIFLIIIKFYQVKNKFVNALKDGWMSSCNIKL